MQVKNTGLLVRKSWRISRWCQQILSHQTYSKSVAPLFCTSLSFTGWRFAIYLYLYTKKCASIPCLIEMYLRKDSFFVLFCFKSSQKIMMPAPPPWNMLLIPPWISEPDNSGGLVCISQFTFKSTTKPCKPSTQAQYSAHLTHLSKDTGSGKSPALMTSLRALLASYAYFCVFLISGIPLTSEFL